MVYLLYISVVMKMHNLHKISDEELVNLLTKDNQKAFTEIYNRYALNLADFAISKLNQVEDAQDIIHDLFIKLWEGRRSLIITANLKTYLFTLVRYKVIDKIRHNITRREYASTAQRIADYFDHGTNQQLEVRELNLLLQNSLKEMPPRVQQIYQLSRHQHHSVAEIAKSLNISTQTVKNQLSKALKHLKKSIGNVIIIIAILINNSL
ncbi:RNA polymerase sigma-70 factor, ECF subfamily [Pedobacter suwonensis]|uniref:RNA polymerase sigma-70 factor, ECF subfamily n=1 Tax=Pedobacter suwonensis TaxID=332999 RepID=A0A1I0TNF1_9SPHI|nr:RNA polymerase sigma-70 factor [Pedobacter suwonensis]SFA53247.1 RNA polymerase sigma-70 factor, ECF subfamily [Pedobacter suwonensis]